MLGMHFLEMFFFNNNVSIWLKLFIIIPLEAGTPNDRNILSMSPLLPLQLNPTAIFKRERGSNIDGIN